MALKIKNEYHLNKIIFIPTGISPIGKIFRTSIVDRVKMLKNSIANHKSLSINDYELRSQKTSYSYNTINYFRDLYAQDKLRLIIGEDNFMSFTEWYKYEDIMKLVNIIVLSRDNVLRCDNIDFIQSLLEENINLFNEAIFGKIHFSVKHKSIISSTMIRERIRANQSFQNYVSKENYKYIFDNGLYK